MVQTSIFGHSKNRHNDPFIPGVLTILFGKGVSNLAAYSLWLTRSGICTQGGAGYYKIALPGEEEITVAD